MSGSRRKWLRDLFFADAGRSPTKTEMNRMKRNYTHIYKSPDAIRKAA